MIYKKVFQNNFQRRVKTRKNNEVINFVRYYFSFIVIYIVYKIYLDVEIVLFVLSTFQNNVM